MKLRMLAVAAGFVVLPATVFAQVPTDTTAKDTTAPAVTAPAPAPAPAPDSPREQAREAELEKANEKLSSLNEHGLKLA